MTPENDIRQIIREWFAMGYMYGRNDALDGLPYDAQLPLERGTPTDSPRQCDGTSTTRASDQSTRTSRA